MSIFDDFLIALKDELKRIATGELEEFRDALMKDGVAFAEKARDDLERWTDQLAGQEMTIEEFEFLLKGKKDLVEMEALKQAGLALARLDRLRGSILDAVVGTVARALP